MPNSGNRGRLWGDSEKTVPEFAIFCDQAGKMIDFSVGQVPEVSVGEVNFHEPGRSYLRSGDPEARSKF